MPIDIEIDFFYGVDLPTCLKVRGIRREQRGEMLAAEYRRRSGGAPLPRAGQGRAHQRTSVQLDPGVYQRKTRKRSKSI